MPGTYDELSEMLRAAQQSHALGEINLAESLYKEALIDHPSDREAMVGYSSDDKRLLLRKACSGVFLRAPR